MSKRGVLFKRSDFLKEYNARHFVLEPPHLTYSMPESPLKVHKALDLCMCKIERGAVTVLPGQQAIHLFVVTKVGAGAVLRLGATSAADADAWVAALKAAAGVATRAMVRGAADGDAPAPQPAPHTQPAPRAQPAPSTQPVTHAQPAPDRASPLRTSPPPQSPAPAPATARSPPPAWERSPSAQAASLAASASAAASLALQSLSSTPSSSSSTLVANEVQRHISDLQTDRTPHKDASPPAAAPPDGPGVGDTPGAPKFAQTPAKRDGAGPPRRAEDARAAPRAASPDAPAALTSGRLARPSSTVFLVPPLLYVLLRPIPFLADLRGPAFALALLAVVLRTSPKLFQAEAARQPTKV
ncbi:hypothetical protein M885DRAFT_535205, partial [Pelagophyceae sp. CCMP2097]